jgi:hypothetical protein
MKQNISRHLLAGIPGKFDQGEILNWIAKRRKKIMSNPVKERMAC